MSPTGEREGGRPTMESLIVEVAGPRGVGKSTFVELLLVELRSRQVHHNQLEPFGTLRRLAFWLGSSVGRAYTRTVWPRLRPLTREEIRIFQRRFWRYRFRLLRFRSSPGVHVVDEGIYQLLLMLTVKSTVDDPAQIADRLRRMTRFPDLVIFLTASETEISARRRLRGNARDLKKPVMSPASLEALQKVTAMLQQLPRSYGESVLVESVDRSALQSAAEASAALISQRVGEMLEPLPGRDR